MHAEKRLRHRVFSELCEHRAVTHNATCVPAKAVYDRAKGHCCIVLLMFYEFRSAIPSNMIARIRLNSVMVVSFPHPSAHFKITFPDCPDRITSNPFSNSL